MIHALHDSWPPSAEPVPSQGTRTTDGMMDVRLRETLHELHDGAWWTGVRVLAPTRPAARFRVKVIQNDGTKLWPAWTQDAGDWHPLPFPIPAWVARGLGLCVNIKQVGDDVNGAIFTRRVLSFLECPEMSAEDCLLFVDDDGDIRNYWDARQERWGCIEDREEAENPTPRWSEPHTVIPVSSYLITHPGWVTRRDFRPESWRSRCELD
jgi:hypothetical protein